MAKRVSAKPIGLFDEMPVERGRQTPFSRADSALKALGYAEGTIVEFNRFFAHYCKHRGKPDWAVVQGWIDYLERLRAWKYDMEDLAYLIKACYCSDRCYLTIPREMSSASGEYWFAKGERAGADRESSGKEY